MKNKAVFHVRENTRSHAFSAALLLAAALLLLAGFAGPAAAAPVNKDGKIYACYKVKGKPRGAMRVLFKGKRCRRGERRVAWVAASSSGTLQQSGAGGQAGPGGASGASGSSGSDGADGADLAAKVASLSLQVQGLEGLLAGIGKGDLIGLASVLDGVTKADLSGTIGAVKGLTNADLLKAVDAVPLLETVCGQAATLTSQSNLLRTGIGSLVSTLAGSLLGPIFGSVALPAALEPFTCVEP